MRLPACQTLDQSELIAKAEMAAAKKTVRASAA
jgi:hypothetical protein